MSSPGTQRFFVGRFFAIAAVALVSAHCAHLSARAELQITEVMLDPLDGDVWQWIEIRNTDPNAIDLNGALGDSLDGRLFFQFDPPSIDNILASNTVIPAKGVAVLYDANLSGNSDADFNDQLFRDAWELDNSVSLIGVDLFPELSGGGSIGFWEDYSSYSQDLVNPGGGFVVGNFDHALFAVDFSNGFPTAPSGTSISWNGQGSYQDGANWASSQNTVTSVSASIQAPLNSTADLGSPGLQPAGTFNASLVITELMVLPDSPQPDWEWIEVYNGTGAAIDFANTNYVLDDKNGQQLLAANITSGSIAEGTTAVLYNGDTLSPQMIQDAWDPNGALSTNFIPVTDFSALPTSGTVALWESFAEYDSEDTLGPGRTTENAQTALTYEGDGFNWPTFDQGSSNYLVVPNSDPNSPMHGDDWDKSIFDPNAFFAKEVMGDFEIHAGGDNGSPGQFATLLEDADFDDDNDVDGFDFLTWQRGLAAGTSHAEGDANGDGTVDSDDLAIWEDQYGTTLFGADFNKDGNVDALDLAQWKGDYGLNAFSDADGDGDSDGNDFLIWQRQYGQSPPLAASHAVPEPASWMLLLLALAASFRLLGSPRCAGRVF
jgi:hypothetical protein